MAEVTQVIAGKQLYVVRPNMSSPYFTIKEKTVNNEVENSKKLFYRFPKQTRNDIQAARQSVNVVLAGCVDFYGLKVTNDLGRQQITDAVTAAHHRMTTIDPMLKADVQFLPLSMAGMAQGNLLDAMVTQIREQIEGAMFEQIQARIEKYGDNMPTKTKGTLLKVIERIRSINVIDDPNINARIEEMKQRITNDQIKPLFDEMKAMMMEDKDRFSTVDLVMENDVDEIGENGAKAQAVDESELPGEIEPAEPKPRATSSMFSQRIDVEDMDD